MALGGDKPLHEPMTHVVARTQYVQSNLKTPLSRYINWILGNHAIMSMIFFVNTDPYYNPNGGLTKKPSHRLSWDMDE